MTNQQSIVFSSTTQLAAAIRSHSLSAVAVLEAYLTQIDKHNHALNAIVTLDAEGARRRAREADEALARGELWGPLHGVPFTLKDAFATAGMRTTTGYPPLSGVVPDFDSTVAARLKAAGGILMGKTNVAMLLGDFQSNNPIFGRTNNPWNVERTSGGSSGGAAAAVAAGLTPFDIGTDLSGSVRIPAHFCGLFGLKPTERRVSLEGLIPGLSAPRSIRILSCVGPLARTVDDLALLYGIIAGPDGADTEVPPVPVEAMPEVALGKLRVAVAPNLFGLPVAAEVRAAVAELAAKLQPLCATVEEAVLPQLNVQDDLSRFGDLTGMLLGVFQPAADGKAATLAQYLEALNRRDLSINAWEHFFQAWDVLLCPPAMRTAFAHCEPGIPLDVDGHTETYWAISAHSALFNYSGHPAVILPYTRDHEGLPLGIQLVGKRWDESRLLGIARALTVVTGAAPHPSGY